MCHPAWARARERAAREQEARERAAPDPVVPGPAVPEPIAPGPVVPEQVVPVRAAPDPVASWTADRPRPTDPPRRTPAAPGPPRPVAGGTTGP